jgi:hypothetical protein
VCAPQYTAGDMGNGWHSVLTTWRTWAISGATGIVGTWLGAWLGAIFRWFYPSRKEWREERHLKDEKQIDARVYAYLDSLGAALQDARQIAAALGLEKDIAAESLERLEGRGRIRRLGGTTDNPSPTWISLHV